MSSIGTVGVRVIPNLSGFGASVSSAVAGSGSVLTRSGAAAGLLISAPIVATVAKGISEAVNFESALAGVAKTVEGSPADIKKIGEDARQAAKEMPFLREEILGVYEAAGTFGVPVNDISKFGDLMIKLGVAIPDLGAETAAREMSKFFNIMGTTGGNQEKTLDTVVALGNDFATTEQQIISFGQRLTQATAVAPLTEANILGLSAAFTALGVKPQAGGTAISRVFYKMNDAIKGNEKTMGQFTKVMGITSDEFKNLYNSDPNQLFIDFEKSIGRLNETGANTPQILKDMGLGEIRVRDALLRGAQGVEELERANELANDSFASGSALQVEYEKRLDTTAAKWQIFKNKASDAALTLGQALLPVMVDLMDAMEPIIGVITVLAEGFSNLPEPVRQMAAMFGLIIVALGPMLFIGSKIAPMFGAIGAAFTALSANPVMLILMAIALVALLIIIHWDTLKQWFFAFWEWFYTNWDRLYAWFSEKLNELGTAWENTWAWIADFFYGKYQMIAGWWDGLIGKVGDLIGWFLNLRDNFGMAWDWIVQKAGQAKDQLVRIMGEIGAAADRALGPLDEIIGGGVNLALGAYRQVVGKDNGGIVPGPIGAPRMILAHGGEEISPRHKQGTTVGGINVSIGNVTMANDMDVLQTARALARETKREMEALG